MNRHFGPGFPEPSLYKVVYEAHVPQPTPQTYWIKISQAPGEIHLPALLPILILKWFYPYPGVVWFFSFFFNSHVKPLEN